MKEKSKTNTWERTFQVDRTANTRALRCEDAAHVSEQRSLLSVGVGGGQKLRAGGGSDLVAAGRTLNQILSRIRGLRAGG